MQGTSVPAPGVSWGSPDAARARRRHSGSAVITFLDGDGSHTPPYVPSPLSARHAGAAVDGGSPHSSDLPEGHEVEGEDAPVMPTPVVRSGPQSFLARFQSNIMQLSVTEPEELVVHAAPPVMAEAGTPLPVTATPLPLHGDAQVTSSSSTAVVGASGTSTASTTRGSSPKGTLLKATPFVAVPARGTPQRSMLHSGGTRTEGEQRPAQVLGVVPVLASATGYSSPTRPGSTSASPRTDTSMMGPSTRKPARISHAAGLANTSSRAGLGVASHESKAPPATAEMCAEVFSESLLPATQFLQHAVRKQEEAGLTGTVRTRAAGGGEAGSPSEAARPARQSIAVSTDATGATSGKPVSAGLALLERGLGDEATALHRQRERNNYFIRKHMQNVEAARESQQELKSFEQTLRQMEDRNTVAVRRHRLPRKPGRGQQRHHSGASADAEDEWINSGDDDDDDDDADDMEDGEDTEETDRANNRAATDSTLRAAAESWAAVQRLQVENPRITQALQQEVRASQARLNGSRTRRANTARTGTTSSRQGTSPPLSARAYPKPTMMSEPPDVNWGGLSAGGGGGATPGAPAGEALANGTATSSQTTALTVPPPLSALQAHDDDGTSTALAPHEALTRADAVIDAYLGQAGTGLRNLGKPRGESRHMRSIEEQLGVLLEFGNGPTLYRGRATQGPPRRRSVKRATSSDTTVVEAGPSLPALSPSKAPTRRASSSPPVRPPVDEPQPPLASPSASHTQPSIEANLDDPQSSPPPPPAPTSAYTASVQAHDSGDHRGGAHTTGQKRVTFSQPPTAGAAASFHRASAVAASSPPSRRASELHRGSATGQEAVVSSAPGESEGDCGRALSTALTSAPHTGKPRKRFKRAAKGREALPVTLGVANHSAALLQQVILTSRRRNLEMEVSKASDISRSVKLLSELHPLREELLQRDVIGGYQTNPPEEWSTLYESGHGGDDGGAASTSGRLPMLPGTTTALATTTPGGTQLPTWATPQQVLDAHQKVIMGRAVEIDAEERRAARLLYVDVLCAMCLERVPESIQPAVLATLDHARELLAYSPQLQNFTGFKAAVTAHIPSQELVAWPVQEVLHHLSVMFKVPKAQYKDWLGNVFVQLGNRHDYEARFRVVDRTIKDREIPQEANVRLTLHLCRRLPRALMLTSTQAPTSPAGVHLPTLVSTDGSPLHGGRAGGSPTSVPNLGASTSMNMTFAESGTLTSAQASLNPFAARGASPGGGRAQTLSGQHEYAIRMHAERQTVTSSAVPAGTHSGSSVSPGRDGSVASTTATGAAAVGVSKRVVSFAEQTFKLHLYDTASPIRLTLLQDGQPIAEGRFTVQRYGNGRATQLWLPLQLSSEATLAPGASAGGRSAELKLTIEVLHDKHPTALAM